jgi:hypothetical protein
MGCGSAVIGCRHRDPLTLHWFDPSLSENALLQHYGPLWVLDLAGENRLITPNSKGKVYVAVPPHVRVLLSPHLEGDSVEVRAMFEPQCVAALGLDVSQHFLLRSVYPAAPSFFFFFF